MVQQDSSMNKDETVDYIFKKVLDVTISILSLCVCVFQCVCVCVCVCVIVCVCVFYFEVSGTDVLSGCCCDAGDLASSQSKTKSRVLRSSQVWSLSLLRTTTWMGGQLALTSCPVALAMQATLTLLPLSVFVCLCVSVCLCVCVSVCDCMCVCLYVSVILFCLEVSGTDVF